jgi:hypothetical protein
MVDIRPVEWNNNERVRIDKKSRKQLTGEQSVHEREASAKEKRPGSQNSQTDAFLKRLPRIQTEHSIVPS